ncbi:putative pentatricopeptide repeat-containing protein [Raphanus sativus]|uniref:Pentatricopeptide repeat-containing protein At3g15930 n=1 Tax=Raphanus sativus TaxID=3726 RepID=A0A9W3CQE1_RAPSA|nr:putative pentatricopeptide repeat-containing protein At3g15930 [Raphanus sativus]KAJ4871002.1 putative pentatricopeptide repeat-containing protein [Raphanus sativus]
MLIRNPVNPKASIFKALFNDYSHFISILESCNTTDQFKQLHSQIIIRGLEPNPTIQNKLILSWCSRLGGDMGYAYKLFVKMPEPDVVVWNNMIKGLSRVGCVKEGVGLYLSMLKKGVSPDGYTFPFLLNGLKADDDEALACGEKLHCHVLKFGLGCNVYVQNGLVRMYSLCGLMGMARGVFDRGRKDDVFSWNLMISGCNRMKQYEESVKLFAEMERRMVIPTSVTLLLVLSACSKVRDKDLCKRVHGYVSVGSRESSLKLVNALVNAYAACGEMDTAVRIFNNMKTRDVISWTCIVKGFVDIGNLELARTYFDDMPVRDRISWTIMIDGYLRGDCFNESLELFREMQNAGMVPDEFTMVSVLTACAHLGALEIGEWVKTYIDKNKIKNDVVVGNALIDMYFKCGCSERAQKVFREMRRRDKFTWTAMVVGLANNGQGEAAIKVFFQMQDMSIQPDEITYLGVLSACNHSGMIEQARIFFSKMRSDHRIEPSLAHYGCMVDLLGRAGLVKEAYEMIRNMPMSPNSIVWGALLGASRLHNDESVAELAAKKILELEPDNGAVYALLCNIYAACERWEDLREVRRKMVDIATKTIPGCSLIEVNGVAQEFVCGDKSHLQSEEIHMKLEELAQESTFAEYLPSELLFEAG